MGRSTIAQLITRGKNQNEYNQTGIDSDGKWVDFFNDALNDLASELVLVGVLDIPVVAGTREYTLPDDFLQLYSFVDSSGMPIQRRRTYEDRAKGYYVLNKGDAFVVDMNGYTGDEACTGLYMRYPALLLEANKATQKPEVPTLGENALIYYAISKALRNNNLPGQAQEVEGKYEMERRKIRNAVNSSGGMQ